MKPEEIRNKSFASGLMGYNKAEVTQFLADVANHHEGLLANQKDDALDQAVQDELSHVKAELESARAKHAKVAADYEAQIAELKAQLDDLAKVDELPEIAEFDFGGDYDYFTNMARLSWRAASNGLFAAGWDGKSLPSMAQFDAVITAAIGGLEGKNPEIVALIDAVHAQEEDMYQIGVEFGRLVRQPLRDRVPEIYLSTAESKEEAMTIMYLFNMLHIYTNLGYAAYGDAWTPIGEKTFDAMFAYARFEDVDAFSKGKDLKALAPVSLELANEVIGALTDGKWSFDQVELGGLMDGVLPMVVASIREPRMTDVFDQMPFAGDEGQTIVEEADGLYGELVANSLGTYYRVMLDLGEDMIPHFIFKHNFFKLALAQAYAKLEAADGLSEEERSEVAAGLHDVYVNLTYNLQVPEGDDAGDDGHMAALEVEFPNLDDAGREALKAEIDHYFELVSDPEYNYMKDKAYGRNPNERLLKLLKMELTARMNGYDIPLTNGVTMKEKIAVYVLTKIKVGMRRDDSLRSDLRKLVNKVYSPRREPGMPMSEEYFKSVEDFVDKNYPDFSALLPRY